MQAEDPGDNAGPNELDRALLERCMTAMAAGDAAFVFTFIAAFGAHLARAVRSIVADMGRTDVLHDAAEIDALVQDAAFVIFDAAGGWRADGGALPWTWAHLAIRAEVGRKVGHRTVGSDENLDFEVSTVGLFDGAGLGVDDLDALAARYDAVGLLVELAHAAGSERDARVFLEYRPQRRIGDHSPADTLAGEFGLSPANIRQIHSRMTAKVRLLAAADPRYAPIVDLPFLVA